MPRRCGCGARPVGADVNPFGERDQPHVKHVEKPPRRVCQKPELKSLCPWGSAQIVCLGAHATCLRDWRSASSHGNRRLVVSSGARSALACKAPPIARSRRSCTRPASRSTLHVPRHPHWLPRAAPSCSQTAMIASIPKDGRGPRGVSGRKGRMRIFCMRGWNMRVRAYAPDPCKHRPVRPLWFVDFPLRN